MCRYLKDVVLFSIVVVFVFSSMLVAGEKSQYTLDKEGIFRHKTEDFEVKMLKDKDGNIQIYGEGRRLAEGDAYAGKFPLSSPEVTVDKEKLEYTLKQTHACKDGNTVIRIRKMRAVGNSIELSTVFKASGGKSVRDYLPKSYGFAERIRMMGNEYDGGKWKFGDKEGELAARKTPPAKGKDSVWKMKRSGTSASPVKEAAFWQKGENLGFSLKNTPANSMSFTDKGNANKKGIAQTRYLFKMYSVKETPLPETLLIIAPAPKYHKADY